MPVTNAKNLSLQKKSASRVAAVQCLYMLAMTKKKLNADKQVSALKVQLFKNPEEQRVLIGAAVEPNYNLLTQILTAVEASHKEIDTMVDSVLSKEWSRGRMSHVLISILQVATAELFFLEKRPNLKVILDEYSKLTRSFFTETEATFMFAALNKLFENYE